MFILKTLYNLLIFIILPFALPIGYLIALKKKEDDDFFQRFGFITFPEPPEKTLWFHCASVGEVRSLSSISSFIKSNYPDTKIIISTTTATGKKMAETEIEPYFAFLLPLENSMAFEHIIDYMNVKAVVIVDTELWPNLIRIASKHAKVFLLNGRMSDKTFKSYLRYSLIFGRLLNKFETIFTKSERDSEKFEAVKGNREGIITLGNIKFQSRKELNNSGLFAFLKGKTLFSAASTHSGEEEIICNSFKNSDKYDRLVIAPRHLNRVKDAYDAAKKSGLTVSKLAERNPDTDVVIVDRFGALEELYTESDKIFIGGSLNNTGGHNIFEALQFEKSVCTGEQMFNFQEISDIAIKNKVSTTVKDEAELTEYLRKDNSSADFGSFFEELEKDNNRKLTSLKEVLDRCIS